MDDQMMTGPEFRIHLFGEAAVASHKQGATEELCPELNALDDVALFGQIWQWKGLETSDRSLVTIAALVAMGRPDELAAHIKGGMRMGLTPEQIVQAIVQLTFYCGLPRVHDALRVARDVFGASGSSAE